MLRHRVKFSRISTATVNQSPVPSCGIRRSVRINSSPRFVSREDSEAGRALAEMAERTVPIGWTNVYRPIEALRQDLETTLRVEGPATAKLQIDENGPGARELAQALDAQTEGGRYDALALCVWQIKEDELGGQQEIKVISY